MSDLVAIVSIISPLTMLTALHPRKADPQSDIDKEIKSADKYVGLFWVKVQM